MGDSKLYLDHLARLARAYEAIFVAEQLDAILIHSGTPRPRSTFDDQFWPLRVVPHFAHWTPLAEADAVLVVRPGKKPTLVRLVENNFWEKPAASPDDATIGFDLVEVASVAAAKAALPASSSKVAFIGEDAARAAQLGHSLSASPSLLRAIDETRVKKSPYEIDQLDVANRIAMKGHHVVRDAFASGEALSELDLHLLYLGATAQDDPETPYKNIVALGEHAATLHHVSYGRVGGPGATSLLLDAGATSRGYASDITRTYVRGASVEVDVFRGMIEGVDRLQQRLCDEATVGKKYEALHDQAHVYIGETLKAAGIVRGSVEEAVSKGITRAFLPHGLGHSLGVTCHDVGCAEVKPRGENPFLRNTRTIEPEQVFTIEPGIYFIPALLTPHRGSTLVDWKLVDALAPLGGIRIEDDLVVRAGTNDNLTRAYSGAQLTTEGCEL